MSGAIMPEPLAKPLSVTGTPSIFALRVAPLGKVSVVRMARAASDQPSVDAAAEAAGRPARIFAAGGGARRRSAAARGTAPAPMARAWSPSDRSGLRRRRCGWRPRRLRPIEIEGLDLGAGPQLLDLLVDQLALEQRHHLRPRLLHGGRRGGAAVHQQDHVIA